jgi:hypothetical protein
MVRGRPVRGHAFSAGPDTNDIEAIVAEIGIMQFP